MTALTIAVIILTIQTMGGLEIQFTKEIHLVINFKSLLFQWYKGGEFICRLDLIYVADIQKMNAVHRKYKTLEKRKFLFFEWTYYKISKTEAYDIYPSGYNYENDPNHLDKLKKLNDSTYYY